MLRCGVCGAAMLPRSPSDSRDVYVCRTPKQTGGATACPMPPLPRTAVDYAALQLFQRWALSVEGTRRKVGEAADARLAEVRAQAARAEAAGAGRTS